MYVLDENYPTATDDTITVGVGMVDFDPLENDTDPDDDPLTISSWTLPTNGQLTMVEGVFYYTPNTNFSGTDTFTYVVSDGRGGTARPRSA